jgi:ArsR family transcriptional regulator
VPFTAGRPIAEAKAALFKALAHPVRIRVLELLADREHTVGELASATGIEMSHLSQQLSVLRRTGIVQSRRVKNTVYCSLADPETSALLAVARRMLTKNLRQGQALLAELDGDSKAAP